MQKIGVNRFPLLFSEFKTKAGKINFGGINKISWRSTPEIDHPLVFGQGKP